MGGSNKNSRVIQGCPARVDLVLQAWNGRAGQRRGTGDMRSSGGSAARKRIYSIGTVRGRSYACARGANIRFYAAASIDISRTATGKGSIFISAGNQGAGRVRCRIKRW